MPWVVGVDEAGYGPNLGPLLQAAVAVKLPAADPAGWNTLRPLVRRANERADGRLLVDDSKEVHKGPNGLAKLERAVLALLGPAGGTLGSLLGVVGLPWVAGELEAERWYDPLERVPLGSGPALVARASSPGVVDQPGLGSPGHKNEPSLDLGFGTARVSLVPAPRFNRIVDESDSKATVLARGLIELIHNVLADLPADGEPLVVVCDKQGGRNFYTSLVQSAFPDGWVTAEREGADESRYRVAGLDREVSVTFRPRADAGSVSVALASMLCKYLREVCMMQFNRFWATHVPGLTPTSGYPNDAKRFYAAIRGPMADLGLTKDQVWRKR